MKNTQTNKPAHSKRKELNNIASPFARWLNLKGQHVIKWRKSRDHKREARAARADLRTAKADAYARDLLRPLVDLRIALAAEMRTQKRESGRFEVAGRYSSQIDTMVQRIEKRHPTQSKLCDFTNMMQPEFRRVPISQGRDVAKDLAVSERLEQFFWLSDEGVFADFRRCALPSCAQYFYPLRPERLYCSAGCQRIQYKQSPEYKKRNREYQREYYRQWLSVGEVKG